MTNLLAYPSIYNGNSKSLIPQRFKRGIVLESHPVSEKNILILASNSPRRRQLLSLGGWTYNVAVADVDESLHPGEAPGDYVLRLAESKARKSAENAAIRKRRHCG